MQFHIPSVQTFPLRQEHVREEEIRGTERDKELNTQWDILF